jgi:hypothetical protein
MKTQHKAEKVNVMTYTIMAVMRGNDDNNDNNRKSPFICEFEQFFDPASSLSGKMARRKFVRENCIYICRI